MFLDYNRGKTRLNSRFQIFGGHLIHSVSAFPRVSRARVHHSVKIVRARIALFMAENTPLVNLFHPIFQPPLPYGIKIGYLSKTYILVRIKFAFSQLVTKRLSRLV